MGLLDGQTDKESWLDPETGLLFHNNKYNWNNTDPLIETPSAEGFVVDEDLSTFTETTEPTFEERVVEPDRSTFTDITPNKSKITDTQTRLNDVNTELGGLNQFFHNVIDKEFSGGFMGFNPVNSMAHSAIGEHMRAYNNPNKITQYMIDNTRAMIIDKAGSKLGPQKTAYILGRFNQYAQKIEEYKKSMKGL